MYAPITAILCSLFFFTSSVLSAISPQHTQEKGSGRKYLTLNYPSSTLGGSTVLTGIKRVKNISNKFYITGMYTCPDQACIIPFIYKGRLSGKGTWHVLNFPSSAGRTVVSTNLYGLNSNVKSRIQVVGNYTTQEADTLSMGCLYEGKLNGSGKWITLIPPSSEPIVSTTAQSTMGGLVVGTYNTQTGADQAFIYNIKHKKYYEITKPGTLNITAYGIWHNGGNSYTICGGYQNISNPYLESAYLVDWDKKRGKLSNWRLYSYNNNSVTSPITYFNGIASDGHGGYNLTGNWLGTNTQEQTAKVCKIFLQTGCPEPGFFCHVTRKATQWSQLSFPNQLITSGNAIYKKVIVGAYIPPTDFPINGYISKP